MPLPVPFKDKGYASLKELQDLEERVQQVPESIIDKYAKQIGAIYGRLEELENNTTTKGTAVEIQRNLHRLRTDQEALSNEADRRVRESIKGLRHQMDVKMDEVKRSFVTLTPCLRTLRCPKRSMAWTYKIPNLLAYMKKCVKG